MSVAQVEAANHLPNECAARPKNAPDDGSQDTVTSANNSNGATIAADNGRSQYVTKPPTDDEDQASRDGFPSRLRTCMVLSVFIFIFWHFSGIFCDAPTGKYCLTGLGSK